METKFDPENIKQDFPLLQQTQNGRPLVFLDSAASSQRPQQVIDAVSSFYENDYANVHRGVYQVAERATNAYENARRATAKFVGATNSDEIVFTKNATEAINLVANSWGRQNLNTGDVVVLSLLEHHANIVPWQMLAAEKSLTIRWIPVTDDGRLELSGLTELLDGAKLLAITATSNVTGAVTDLDHMIGAARKAGATVVVDACQSVPHLRTNVTELDADFLAFAGHKMLGPSGIGVLWAKKALLEAMPPFMGGGGMIADVSQDGFRAADLPAKFEAGTPPIAQAVGLHAAINYLEQVGLDAIERHTSQLTQYALDELDKQFGEQIRIVGPTDNNDRGAVLSLDVKNVHPHDVSQILDEQAVCIRPGNHCAKPLMKHFEINATARASFYLYNTEQDVDSLVNALKASVDFFK